MSLLAVTPPIAKCMARLSAAFQADRKQATDHDERTVGRMLGQNAPESLGEGSDMKQPEPPPNAAQLMAALITHCSSKSYTLDGPEPDKHGYLKFRVVVPGQDEAFLISFNGEVFALSLPSGYSWTEFAHYPHDGLEALAATLAFMDAYADPGTREVEVKRCLRPPRPELHVSNGAVLRKRGWSIGPPDTASS